MIPISLPREFYVLLKTMVKKARKSNIIITGLLLRDKNKSKRRYRLLKVNSYLSNFCKN